MIVYGYEDDTSASGTSFTMSRREAQENTEPGDSITRYTIGRPTKTLLVAGLNQSAFAAKVETLTVKRKE